MLHQDFSLHCSLDPKTGTIARAGLASHPSELQALYHKPYPINLRLPYAISDTLVIALVAGNHLVTLSRTHV